MPVVSPNSFEGFTFDTSVPEDTQVLTAIVTGTYSAGKTTLINDFMDRAGNARLLEQTGVAIPAGFRAGFMSIPEANDILVPIVSAPEAATQYAKKRGDQTVLTRSYSVHHQVQIEAKAKRNAVRATVLAANIACGLSKQRERLTQPLGIALLDRSPLDGLVFAEHRLNDRQANVDFAEVVRNTGGWLSQNYDGSPVDYAARIRDLVGFLADLVVIADSSEIDLELNGLRPDDADERAAIGQEMQDEYEETSRYAKFTLLVGDRERRVSRLAKHLNMLIEMELQSGPTQLKAA